MTRNWFTAFINWVKEFLGKVWKQIIAPFTDKDWDLDGQKLVGWGIVALGVTIIIQCMVKWDFSGNAPNYALVLIGFGGGMIGWRSHTDQGVK